MGTTVTLAGTLRESYDKSLGYLFNTAAGQVIATIAGIVAVGLFALLVFALIQKARGRDGQVVGMFASDGKKIAINVFAIIILLGPSLWFPWFASGFDTVIEGLQGWIRSAFNW